MTDTLPNILNKMDRDRLNSYRQYLDFYGGQHWPAGGGPNQANQRRLTFNYAKVV